MKIFLLLVFLATFIGCGLNGPMNVVMTNPNTGKCVYVSHSSWGFGMAGVAAAINAAQQQKMAIEAAKMMGYTEMQDVGAKPKLTPEPEKTYTEVEQEAVK
jgi:hypothetical protein